MNTEHLYPDQDTLFSALLEYCLQTLHEDLQQHAGVSWFLSGGSTPAPFYSRLAGASLPWQRISTALVDERWVPVDHSASNEGMLRRLFQGNNALLQNLTGMYSDHPSAHLAEAACNQRYARLPQPFSLCLLGLGTDGHTASLFPGAAGLHEALAGKQLCKAIAAHPSAVTGKLTERMSLTLHAITRCRRIALLFTGKRKWEVYQQALHCHDSESLPVSAVLTSTGAHVDVFYCP